MGRLQIVVFAILETCAVELGLVLALELSPGAPKLVSCEELLGPSLLLLCVVALGAVPIYEDVAHKIYLYF